MNPVRGRNSIANSFFVISASIFDSALEKKRSKACNVLRIYAQSTACFPRVIARSPLCRKLKPCNVLCGPRDSRLLLGQAKVEIVKAPAYTGKMEPELDSIAANDK